MEEETALDKLRDASANGQIHPAVLPALLEVGRGGGGEELEAIAAAVTNLSQRVRVLESDQASRAAEVPDAAPVVADEGAPAVKGSKK